MKKYLLAGLAAAGLGLAAGSASADDPVKLTLSGNIVEWVGFVSQDQNYIHAVNGASSKTDGFTQWQDSDMTFAGSTKLDNGLTVGATIGLKSGPTKQEANETAGNGTGINDVSFVTISGGFGSVQAGRFYAITHDMAIDAPEEGYLFVSDGYWGDPFVLSAYGFNNPGRTAFYDENSATNIRYVTPSFSGFQAGIDYFQGSSLSGGAVAVMNVTGGASNNIRPYEDAWHAIATWGGDLGSAKVKAEFGGGSENGRPSGTAAAPAKYNNTAFQGGLSVTVSGFTIAGSFLDRMAPTADQVAGQKGTSWDVGLAYENGPWGVSIAYLDAPAPDATVVTLKDDFTFYEIGGHYTLGPGITANLNVWHETTKADMSGIGLNAAGATHSVGGTGVLLSTNVGF